MKKYLAGAVLSLGIIISPAFTHAAGLTISQVDAILSLLSSFGADQSVISNVKASLTGGTSTNSSTAFCHNFSSDLTVGSGGAEVYALNQALNLSGVGMDGNVSSSFNEDIASGVVAFQAKYGIRQTGYVGPVTRAKLNALYGCSNQTTTQTTATTIWAHCSGGDPSTDCVNLPTATIGVTYPDSGQILTPGDTVYVQWKYANLAGTVVNVTLDSVDAQRHLATNVPTERGGTTIIIPVTDSLGTLREGPATISVWVTGLRDGDPRLVKSAVPVAIRNKQVIAPIATINPIYPVAIVSSFSTIISGTARNTTSFGLAISGPGGDKVWSSGTIPVVGGNWSVTVLPALRVSGTYTAIAYDNNVELAHSSFYIPNLWPTQSFAAPTASISINGSKNLTLPVGTEYTWKWSSTNGTSYSSSYTSNASYCGSGPWVANSMNGSNSGTITSAMAGCSWVNKYTVTGPGGTITDTVYLSVPSAPAVTVAPTINYFTSTENPVTSGQPATIRWDVTSSGTGTSCSLSETTPTPRIIYNYGSMLLSSTGTGTYNLTAQTTYRIDCRNNEGWTSWKTLTLAVTAVAAPVAPTINSFTATPITAGQSTLSWTSTGADTTFNSCNLDAGGVGLGLKPANGSLPVSPTVTTTYNLVCGKYNPTTFSTVYSPVAHVTVTVTQPATVALTAPTGLASSCSSSGTQATLSWNSVAGASSYSIRADNTTRGQNDNPCTGTAGDYCNESVSGTSISVSTIAGDSYRWWVHSRDTAGNWSPASSIATFSCSAPATPVAPTINSFTATPSSITAGLGQSSTLSWTSTGADTTFNSCTLDAGGTVGFGQKPANSSLPVSPTVTTTYNLVCGKYDPTTLSTLYSPVAHVTVTVNQPPAVALTAPTGLAYSCTGGNQVAMLSWNSVAGASSYSIRVDDMNKGLNDNPCNGTTGDYCNEAASGTATVVSIIAGDSYRWWIHARNTAGDWGPASSLASFNCAVIAMNNNTNTSQTASALNAAESATQSPSIMQGTASGFSYTFTQDIYRGMQGSEVVALQRALHAEGLFAGEATGNFYDVTREAVMAFQIKYGINPTGYVGSETKAKLNALY